MAVIPKKIHYIWFGKNQKSELILNCIESWKKYLPDWEFIEWNEDNYNVNKGAYISEAYQNKKYAFAADYARFDILYEYGGIYLDTDVELLKPIPEDFLELNGFVGVEGNNKIAPGLIIAVAPKNKMIKRVKEHYESIHFIENEKMNTETVVNYTTDIFKTHGFIRNGKMQDIEGIRVFPAEYFCAYDFDIREFHITDKTISIHHYTNTWSSKRSKKIISIKMFIKKTIGVKNYKILLNIKRKLFGIRGE